MSFVLYLVGFALLTGGIAWGLVTAGVPTLYVAIACVILLGLGIITGVYPGPAQKTLRPDDGHG